MAGKRRRFTPEFKARVALEALRERDSVQAIAARHELHPNQVSAWKRQLLDAVPEVFAKGGRRKLAREHEAKIHGSWSFGNKNDGDNGRPSSSRVRFRHARRLSASALASKI